MLLALERKTWWEKEGNLLFTVHPFIPFEFGTTGYEKVIIKEKILSLMCPPAPAPLRKMCTARGGREVGL